MSLNHEKALYIGNIISDLKSKFFPHTPYAQLQEQFDLMLYQRRAEIAAGRNIEARGIAVIGNSGSGKSTAVSRLLSKHSDLQALSPNTVRAEVVSLSVPSPATLKHVGLSCLNALGYPLRRDRTAGIIWELVQTHLQQRETLFLHLDESQDLFTNRNEREMQSVVNTLKSLMQSPNWPIGLVLSGMPSLKDLLHLDPQLRRRFVPIELPQVSFSTHGKIISELISQYLASAKLPIADATYSDELAKRLIHAGVYELGIIIEIIIGSVEEALLAERSAVGIGDFAAAFRRRSGCLDELNPFLIEDYKSVNAARLLEVVEDEDASLYEQGKKGKPK